jgi:hypothetical protein
MNKKALSSILACGLAVFFTFIIFFILYGFMELADSDNAMPATIFAGINCLVIIFMASAKNKIAEATSAATNIQLWTITCLYSALQFISLFLFGNSAEPKWYILYHIIVLFLFFLILVPTLMVGLKSDKK